MDHADEMETTETPPSSVEYEAPAHVSEPLAPVCEEEATVVPLSSSSDVDSPSDAVEPPSNPTPKRTTSLTISATATAAVLSPMRSSAANKQLLFIKTSDSPSSHHSERARHQHTRKVTRDIAALDFLQNIPMSAEKLGHHHHSHTHYHDGRHPSPPRVAFHVKGDASASLAGHNRNPEDPDTLDNDNAGGGDNDNDNDSNLTAGGYSLEDEGLAGRRLPGFEAKIVSIPSAFRYRMTTKYPAASAVVRRWESMTAQQGVLDSRVFFSRGCGYPIAASTLLKYNGNETSAPSTAMRKRFMSVSNLEPSSYDWRGKSYYRLLHATWTPCAQDRDSQDDHPVATPYLPNYLDDPEFRQGRHRHVVRGDKNIGPVISSILLFVKPHELKEELNKKFHEKHTWLHDNELSLSKIRNLKRETLATCQRLDLEVATAALACVYFEKLILNHYVNKSNRKLYMAVCLLLAAKFNEPKASDAMTLTIKQILAEIDATHSLPSRDVLTTEFKIYAQLSFSLHVPIGEIQPHFTRLLKMIESNPRKYLDEDVFNEYSKLILEEKTAAMLANRGPANETVMSIDGETQDEGTDAEALMSDEDLEEMDEDGGLASPTGAGGESNDARMKRQESDGSRRRSSVPPWHRMPSFAQWWRERRWDSAQQPQSQAAHAQAQLQADDSTTSPGGNGEDDADGSAAQRTKEEE